MSKLDKEYKVVSIPREQTIEWLMYKHYAKRMCSITYSFGLFHGLECVGVCTFGMPPSSTLAGSICGKEYKELVIELNRLVLNDNLPKNSTSFLVSRSISMLPKSKIIVSFSDLNMGHNGYIYQACNFIYNGKSSNTSKLIQKDGTEFHFRNIGHKQKALKKEINLIDRIISNLSDDLLKPEYRNIDEKNKYTGHCYVASETYYHLSNQSLSVYHIKHEGSIHWFLKDNETNYIIDLTSSQFKTPVPYNAAKRGFFLTKQPSKRSQILINRVMNTEFKVVKKRINEALINRIEIAEYLKANKGSWNARKLDIEFGYKDTAAHWFRTDNGFSYPSVDDWTKLKELLNLDNKYDNVMSAFELIPCPQDIIKKLELKKVEVLPKNRYVYVHASKKLKRKILSKIKSLPYPKGNNKRYDATFKPNTQTTLF